MCRRVVYHEAAHAVMLETVADIRIDGIIIQDADEGMTLFDEALLRNHEVEVDLAGFLAESFVSPSSTLEEDIGQFIASAQDHEDVMVWFVERGINHPNLRNKYYHAAEIALLRRWPAVIAVAEKLLAMPGFPKQLTGEGVRDIILQVG